MKIAIYQSLSTTSDPEAYEVYNALKRRSDVEKIIFVNPKKLQTNIINNEVFYFTNEVQITRENIDIMIIRGGFSNVNSAIELIKFCRKQGIKVFDNNLENVRYMINKRSDFLKLAEAGVKIPNTYMYADMESFKLDTLRFPLVMKATNTGKGMAVFKVETFEDVEKILIEQDAPIAKFVFQDIINYVHDLRVLVIGNEVLGCMKRIPKAGDFRANFSLGGTVEPFEATEEIKSLAIRAAQACELEISGVDVLVDQDGKLWILEANRTPGLEGISLALGLQIGDKAVQFMIEKAR